MDNLSHTEAYFISTLSTLTDPEDMEKVINLLLGVYVCHFLGHFEKSNGENLLKKIENFQEDTTLFSLVDRLKNLELLEVEKIISFPNLMINKIKIKNKGSCFIKNFLTKKAISHFTKKIRPSFGTYKKKHSKYEVRFFWPSTIDPEVYDPHGFLFNEKYYTHKSAKDKYIVINNKCNIKIRENELQVKEYIKNIGSIAHFKRKKTIKFPIKGKKVEKILQQKMISGSGVFETPGDLVRKLSEFPGISCIEVLKERTLRKMADHTKIEISLIKIQGKEWKTICIESKSVQNILALSLLIINQNNAEKLSYDAFLQKYGASNL